MKLLSLIFLFIFFSNCNGIHGYFPGYTDPQPASVKPASGCARDLIVHVKNNCSQSLIVYFLEQSPGSTFRCETLGGLGTIERDQVTTLTVHQGKLGYLVFAETEDGKCSSAKRKAEFWVNCENASAEEYSFTVCQ